MNMKETTCTQIGQGTLNGMQFRVIVGDDAHIVPKSHETALVR